MTRLLQAPGASGARRPPNDPEQLPDESELDETRSGPLGDEADEPDTVWPDEEPDGGPDPGLAEQ